MIRNILGYDRVVFAPTNIALVKYWGKSSEAEQWPANDSLSMTLDQLGTLTGTALLHAATDHQVKWQGVERYRTSDSKLFGFLDRVCSAFAADDCRLAVATANNFPSDAGIASSASGFAALTLSAAMTLSGADSWESLAASDWPRERLAHLARMGSGSACRSLFPGFVQWSRGENPVQQTVANISNADLKLASFIVVVDPSKKPVSSRDAHRRASSSPLFATRIAGIPERIQRITKGLVHHSFASIGPEIEQEALEMHTIAMTSTPAINYLTAVSWETLTALRQFRQQSQIPAFATIDAGPNIHILTPVAFAAEVAAFVHALCKVSVLRDVTGVGPTLAPSIDFVKERFQAMEALS